MSQHSRGSRHPACLAISGALLLTACAAAQQAAPPELQPADARRAVATLAASGVQIYQCRRDQNNQLSWALQAPEATLQDASGKLVVKHYAGPSWEAPDGSKVTGKLLKQAANTQQPGSIPLLLLQATNAGGPGLFAPVRYVQRLNTQGGIAPPAQACTREGQEARVPYRADYVFIE